MERTRYAIREDRIFVRIAPLDVCSQIVFPQALRRRVLHMNHEPAASAHAGANACTKRSGGACTGHLLLPMSTVRFGNAPHAAGIAPRFERDDHFDTLPRSCASRKRRTVPLEPAA